MELLALLIAPFTLFLFDFGLKGRIDGVWFLNFLLISPIFEELLFRGTILRGLLKYRFFKQKLYLISYANIATSILFVFYHLIFHPIIWALLTFFPSLIFGFIMEKRELVIYPIFIHIFYNFSYLYL